MSKHRNDIYGDTDKAPAKKDEMAPPIPAATVVLLRETNGSPEVLMLHKTSKISFGGMWVFPGGKIDEADFDDSRDPDQAARQAAMRETIEEAGIHIPKEKFVWFAHWTPPAITPKRFSTWFFITAAEEDHDIQVDGGEIQNHQWITPLDALAQHAKGDIDLAPPTWVSLYQLSKFTTVDEAIQKLDAAPPRYYETRIAADESGTRHAIWSGDAGYDGSNADSSGLTHRLVMSKSGFEFLHSAVTYEH